MSDRKRAIETLKQLRLDYEEFYEEHNNEVTQAYDMAIASLETDEAYQLEYESTTKKDLDFKLKDYVSREAVRRIIKSPRTQEQMLNALNSLRNATECKAEDCINRDYTAKYVEEFANNEYVSQDEAETIYLIADGIRHIPSVLPKAEWIPVSERLPEDSGEYLVSVIDEYNEDQSYYKAVEVAWFAHKKDYDIKESEWRELGIDETVIAWMSLPKAYSEVEE